MLHAIRSALGPVARVGKEITYLPTCPSTNDLLKAMAEAGAGEGTVLVAGEQTRGKGRLGRSFTSAAGKGVYLSALLRPQLPPERLLPLMGFTAEAMGRAVRRVAGAEAGIKWVNDLILNGKKICGILTEAGMDLESGQVSYVVVGIGINLRAPEGGFPEEIRNIAGAAFDGLSVPDLRNRLAALVLDRLADYAADPFSDALFDAYAKRSFVPGRKITVLAPGKEPVPAEALRLNRDYSLQVRLEDGREEKLASGEVSIRV